jgi:hypothetical protein
MSSDFIADMDPPAERIGKCAVIDLNAPVEKVFPLFGPVREKEWAEGWDPEIIYSNTSLVEEHMIFRTKAHHPSESHYTWVITQYDPEGYQIGYTVSTVNRIWFIRVVCKAAASRTTAEVCYTYTGLNEAGNDLNRKALGKMYARDLKDWEEAINYYLQYGKQLTNH